VLRAFPRGAYAALAKMLGWGSRPVGGSRPAGLAFGTASGTIADTVRGF